MNPVRIDKWLWAVRLFKTRSQASEACKSGKIIMNNSHVKASREVKAGDIIEVHKNGITKKVGVIKPVKNRVNAKMVTELMDDLTPPEEMERAEMMRKVNYERRDRGTGRPTKKDRRSIERLKDFDE